MNPGHGHHRPRPPASPAHDRPIQILAQQAPPGRWTRLDQQDRATGSSSTAVDNSIIASHLLGHASVLTWNPFKTQGGVSNPAFGEVYHTVC